MFNIGFSELIIILLVALIFVGPKDLPKVGAFLGRSVRKFKGWIAEFKDETGLGDMETEYKATVADLNKTIREADPTKEIREAEKEIRQAGKELESAVRDAEHEVADAAREAKGDSSIPE